MRLNHLAVFGGEFSCLLPSESADVSGARIAALKEALQISAELDAACRARRHNGGPPY